MMSSSPQMPMPSDPEPFRALLIAQGARLAEDGIPLDFGDLESEYDAALSAAVLMERSHEGRLVLSGRDRLAIPHRISTNALDALAQGSCAPTLFVTPNARIIDRATLCNLGDRVLALSEPGRGGSLHLLLQRSIFFNDDLTLGDLSTETRQFVLIGPAAAAVAAQFAPPLAPLSMVQATLGGCEATVIRDKPLGGDPAGDLWRLIVRRSDSTAIWEAIRAGGTPFGLRPAGSLTYHALRVRAGRPGVNAELSPAYIPLEVGLWDEVSFTKGCYTGQEIIARMESRRRLARTIVTVTLSAPVESPSAVSFDGREIGMLTSAVTTPKGEHSGIAVLKVGFSEPGRQIEVGGATGLITRRAGVQPALVEGE